jgi:2-dehydro-3-deoxygluconokinase
MTPDILCLGEPMVEFNEQPDGRFAIGCGGDTSNCAVAAARQGASTGYVSRIGADAFAARLRAMWAEEGVADLVEEDAEAATGLYFVTHSAAGHEFTYRRAGSAASLMRPEHLPVEALGSARILHVSGISQAISESAAETVLAAIAAARGAGATVSYDSNLRLKLWPLDSARSVIHEAMALSHIARPSLDDARLLTGLDSPDAIADFYLRLGARIVALTLGRYGVLVATAERRETIAPCRVESIDATGAGDTFGGAFLAEYLKTGDPFAAARYANAAAALSTTRYGAVASMPRRAEVERFIASA